MRQLNQLILALAFIGISFNLNAQVTLLDETLLTTQSFGTFTTVSVTGNQGWTQSPQYGAVCSGFAGGQSYANEDWLISAPMNAAQLENVNLVFEHTRGNAGVMNVGVSEGWYKAYATANYTGNPATTTWVEFTGLNQNITTAWQYISSGVLPIPATAKSATTRIAFRYQSSAGQSATWEIKNVKITGTEAGFTNFKITNWNTEWLGCTQFGPTNEAQQLANVAAAMVTMNSDIYCIQEVSNTSATTTIASLLALLGNSWGGNIVVTDQDECNQRQAIIYKKATVQFVSSSQLNSGNQSQGNSYSYNWSNGRFPAVYNVNLVVGNNLIPYTLINIHAKAEDGYAISYTRRKGGAEALKTILDGNTYNTKNLILLGDFNDYLIGTNSTTCACTVSPYKNFMDDTNRYNGITQTLYDEFWNRPIIEHIIISNEVTANYVANSAVMESALPLTIPGYFSTTSNHLPISMKLRYSTTAAAEDFTKAADVFTIYPNPVTDVLNIAATSDLADASTTIYDITGRQVYNDKFSTGVNVSALPAGVYIVKIGDVSRKFVKN